MKNLIKPSVEDFRRVFDSGKSQLVYTWIPADLETPVSAYLKLCQEKDYGFLLESIEGGESLGRYSIIGLNPDTLWRLRGDQVELWHDYGGWELENEEPLTSLRAHIAECAIDEVPSGLPPMAVSGLFGYLSYDAVRLIESIPDENPDELNIPESILMRPTVLAIFDNARNMICIVTPVHDHAQKSSSQADTFYQEATTRIQNVLAQIERPLDREKLSQEQKTKCKLPLNVSSNTTQGEFHNMVKKAVEYIHSGEIFQVVPSQRFSMDFDLPSYELYRSLRRLNPSPFMFLLKLGDFSLIGSSPEVLVRVRDSKVTIRPIAGTRKRGADEAEDQALERELLADPKERAEHLMLLDLGRNDVGRVSEIGSVKVTDEFIIERYSHVMHIVSNVEGTLRENLDIVDALFSGFPAGTVSGAPKIRAMEIIDELEKARRGFYAGAVGYFSGNGGLDTCIALRTGLLKDGKLYVQAGGGVVADSDPEFEYQESCNKARALIAAAEDALAHAD